MKKRLPITQWLPRYKKSDLIGDAIAGITVGMTVVPQSMAYAAIAGLTPEVKLKFIPIKSKNKISRDNLM